MVIDKFYSSVCKGCCRIHSVIACVRWLPDTIGDIMIIIVWCTIISPSITSTFKINHFAMYFRVFITRYNCKFAWHMVHSSTSKTPKWMKNNKQWDATIILLYEPLMFSKIESLFSSKIEVLIDNAEAVCLTLKLSLLSLYIIHQRNSLSLHTLCTSRAQLKRKCCLPLVAGKMIPIGNHSLIPSSTLPGFINKF